MSQPDSHVQSPPQVSVYDTTLRDGTQREGLSLSLDDKLRIAVRLDELGVAFIEGGWPGSNPKDVEFFARAADMSWRTAIIAAFGSTCRAGIGAENDSGLKALLAANTQVITIFGKTSAMHVRETLRTTLEENLRIIEDSVSFLRSNGRRVVFDAEHFFDGFQEDPDHAIATLHAAARGGAEVLVLCDTNGGTLPWRIAEVVKQAAAVGLPLGIHTHNDGECAVANAVAAVHAGATHVQGTINGYGERCGNANLCALIPNLELKLGMRCLPEGRLAQLTDVAHFVAEVANLATDDHMAYVGRSAFAHKGGVHVAAMRRNASSYQHVDPALVGNVSRTVVSELSGAATLAEKADEWEFSQDAGAGRRVVNAIKQAESRGFSFEAAEASVALLLRREDPNYRPPFSLLEYKVLVDDRAEHVAQAMVKLAVGSEVMHTAAEGNGPVGALDAALRKALLPMFPALGGIHLVDYKVRILDSARGTSAIVRVLIDSTDGEDRWSTVGASTNIIAASWQALADSVEYGLSLSRSARRVLVDDARRADREAVGGTDAV